MPKLKCNKNEHYRRDEAFYREKALDKNNIAIACAQQCRRSHLATSCLNNMCCANKFGSILETMAAFRNIRQRIWMGGQGWKARKARLGELLLENLVVDTSKRRFFKFRIAGVDVCKDFFKVGTLRKYGSCIL